MVVMERVESDRWMSFAVGFIVTAALIWGLF
jgi:hypothetical protein